MVWSYDGVPYSGRDKVRAIIGDVDTNDQLIEDYQIDAVLVVFSDETEAAAHLCRNLAAKFAAQGNVSVDGYKFENLKKAEFYRDLSKELFLQVHGSKRPLVLANPSYGGVSISGKDANEANTDNVEPAFYRDQFNYPGSDSDDE